jgi:hypothetical protein
LKSDVSGLGQRRENLGATHHHVHDGWRVLGTARAIAITDQ